MQRLDRLLPLGLPLLTAFLSLPMALGLVAPNPVYGYRTASSLAGPEAWYGANANAGWLGVGFSAAALAINLYLLRRTSLPAEKRSLAAVLIFVASMLVCAGLSFYVNE